VILMADQLHRRRL